MGDMVIKTDVDRLISLIEQKKEISFDDAAKELGISSKTIESLSDMLEEEGIIHIKYKFTTPYLLYGKPKSEAGLSHAEEEKFFIEEELDIKKEFLSKAKARGADDEKANKLWKTYVNLYKNYLRENFFKKAKIKGYPQKDIENMWKKFEEGI